MSVKEIFYDVIREAKDGRVIIDNEEFLIGFNSFINNSLSYFNDNNMSSLIIKNEDEFFKYLELYIDNELVLNRKGPSYISNNKDNIIKLLISYLFVNASNYDFNNAINYLKMRISFLSDNFCDNKINLGKVFSPKIDDDIYLEIKRIKQDIRMETPYRIEFSLVCNNSRFNLPYISYGISNDVCYIYSIQSRKQDCSSYEDYEYIKKVKRFLYKIDEGIDKNDDIALVSNSFVLSLTIFIKLLKNMNINKVRNILYLPVRYLSRDIAASSLDDVNRSNELYKRNDMIQSNLTNKFLNTIRRVCYNLEGVNIINDITIDNGYVDVILDSNLNKSNNKLLDNISFKIR